MSNDTAGILIGFCAFILSLFIYWKTNILKPKLVLSSSTWSIQKMKGVNGEIYPTFLVKISAYNKSGLPSKVFDAMLVLIDDKGTKYFYRPAILFDTQKSIEVGNDKWNFGKSQRGLVPLPKIIKPYEELVFGYQVLFTPHTSDKPYAITKTSGNINVQLFISSDRDKEYELVTTQKY